jgi:hypothetical protein
LPLATVSATAKIAPHAAANRPELPLG